LCIIVFAGKIAFMDTIDLKLLRLVQVDSRRSAADLGQEIGLSVSAVSERLRKLNASGVIKATHAVIEPAKVGISLCAFIFIDLEPRADEGLFAKKLAKLAEVQEAHHVTGPHSWLIKVRVPDTDALQYLIARQIKILPGVLRSETVIVLGTAKETSELPLALAHATMPFEEGAP
jgi:Lrp/AsnC family leucine-responsive transcriptional regulator